jgi:hypothetical protein
MAVRLFNRSLLSGLTIFSLLITNCNSPSGRQLKKTTKSNEESVYFVDSDLGSDNNPGTQKKPLKSISELNIRIAENPGNVSFAGGQVFNGTLVLKDISDSTGLQLKIKSWGNGRAVINGGNSEAVKIINCQNIWILDIDFKGNGRREGNTSNGLSFINSKNCRVENINVSGFRKSGVDLYDCTEMRVQKVIASENGFCGINVMGSSKSHSGKILIQACKAENNPGDPTITDNHSGNGILVGVSDSVIIDHCSATNNGWDMPWLGNGPVGIWTWESDHVTIQYCISYRNKTAKNAKDGGGFDLDGGVTNSVIQYCLSYENQGAGYGLFQYSGASPWLKNTVRYCISINDAQTTTGSGSFFIWNGSKDINQLTDCMIYNNVVYNTKAPVISFENSSDHRNFKFCNNIFMFTDQPLSGRNTGSMFIGNDWWNPNGTRQFMQFSSLAEWALVSEQESISGSFVGHQEDPRFKGPILTTLTDTYQLEKFTGFVLSDESTLKDKGIDLNSIFGIKQPEKDFFGNTVPSGVGSEPGIYQMK